MSNFDRLQGATADTLYISQETSEALISAAGFTLVVPGPRYIDPNGLQFWVRSEAAQHAIRIILGR